MRVKTPPPLILSPLEAPNPTNPHSRERRAGVRAKPSGNPSKWLAAREALTPHSSPLTPIQEGRGEGENPAHAHPEPAKGPDPAEEHTLTPHSSPLTPQLTQLTNNIRHTLPYLHPDDFDDIIDDFLEEIGDVRSNYLEYNGDEVTEGVIDLDHVGLDRIHFRAKLSIDPIDELEIRDFSESLDRRDAATGMFITTSDFTDIARRVAETITTENRPIRLVDGTELARYLASIKMERKTASAHHAHKPEENHPNQHT